MLRRPVTSLAAILVGGAAFAVGLPWYAAVAIAVLSLLGGAGLAAWIFAIGARPPGAHVPGPAPDDASPVAVFRLEGEYWTIASRDATFRLVDSKGLRYVHRLLQTPGVEVYALDLELATHPAAATVAGGADGLHADGPTGQLLVDKQALEAYRLRIEDLRDQIEEAERHGDPERASRARDELDYLMDEIDRVTRPDGTPRAQSGETERARVNVTRAIRKAIEKIGEQDPSLGHHLDHDIRTGTYCSYVPDPATTPDWAL